MAAPDSLLGWVTASLAVEPPLAAAVSMRSAVISCLNMRSRDGTKLALISFITSVAAPGTGSDDDEGLTAPSRATGSCIKGTTRAMQQVGGSQSTAAGQATSPTTHTHHIVHGPERAAPDLCPNTKQLSGWLGIEMRLAPLPFRHTSRARYVTRSELQCVVPDG